MALDCGSSGGPQSHTARIRPIKRNAKWRVSPEGPLIIGHPNGDVGLPREIIVNILRGTAPDGGGAILDRIPTKFDRSIASAARYLAKIVVDAA